MTSGGSGYTATPTVNLVGGGGTGATAIATFSTSVALRDRGDDLPGPRLHVASDRLVHRWRRRERGRNRGPGPARRRQRRRQQRRWLHVHTWCRLLGARRDRRHRCREPRPSNGARGQRQRHRSRHGLHHGPRGHLHRWRRVERGRDRDPGPDAGGAPFPDQSRVAVRHRSNGCLQQRQRNRHDHTHCDGRRRRYQRHPGRRGLHGCADRQPFRPAGGHAGICSGHRTGSDRRWGRAHDQPRYMRAARRSADRHLPECQRRRKRRHGDGRGRHSPGHRRCDHEPRQRLHAAAGRRLRWNRVHGSGRHLDPPAHRDPDHHGDKPRERLHQRPARHAHERQRGRQERHRQRNPGQVRGQHHADQWRVRATP